MKKNKNKKNDKRVFVTLDMLVENGNITKKERKSLEKQGYKDGDFYITDGFGRLVWVITNREIGQGYTMEETRLLDSIVGRDTGTFDIDTNTKKEGEKEMKKNQVVVLESKENDIKAVGVDKKERKAFMRYAVRYGVRQNEKPFKDFFDASDFILGLRKEMRESAILVERRGEMYQEYTSAQLETMRTASLRKCGVTAEDVLLVTNGNNFSRAIACMLAMQDALAEMEWERDKDGYLVTTSAKKLRKVWREYVEREKEDATCRVMAYGRA